MDDPDRVNDSGMEAESDADRKAFAMIASAADDARRVPGLSRRAATIIRRLHRASAVSGGVTKPRLKRARVRRMRRAARRTATATGAILVVGAAWTIASDQIDPYKPPPRTQRWKPVFDPLLAEAHVNDPKASVAWGMRAFRRSGRRCVVLGHLVAGRIGRRADGRFQELAAGAPPDCLPRGRSTMVLVRDYGAATGGRTIVYGIAARGVSIGIGRRPPGRPLTIANDGTYVAVLPRSEIANLKAFVISGGKTTTRTLGLP